MRPNQNGQRTHVETFLRNSFDEQARSLAGGPSGPHSKAAQGEPNEQTEQGKQG
jgi:hypothetical protein